MFEMKKTAANTYLALISISMILCSLTLANEFLEDEVFLPLSPFDLTISPRDVYRDRTGNVTLRCAHNGWARSRLVEISRMRILRRNGDSWKLLAEKRDLSGPKTTDRLSLLVTGQVGDTKSASFLQVVWPVARDETFGSYRCSVTGFDQFSRGASEESYEIQIVERVYSPTTQFFWVLLSSSKKTTQSLIDIGRVTNKPQPQQG